MTPFNNPADGSSDHSIPLGGGTVPFCINDPGQIVGDFVDATDGKRHGFLLSQGTYTTLDPPGSNGFTVAEGINDAGTIVGLFLDTSNNPHGWILTKGAYTQIDVPNSAGTVVNTITPQGEIGGYYLDNTSAHFAHGFIGSPR